MKDQAQVTADQLRIDLNEALEKNGSTHEFKQSMADKFAGVLRVVFAAKDAEIARLKDEARKSREEALFVRTQNGNLVHLVEEQRRAIAELEQKLSGKRSEEDQPQIL